MNNGIRITIDRRDGNRWYWKLNAYGDEYLRSVAAKLHPPKLCRLLKLGCSPSKSPSGGRDDDPQ